MRKFSAGVKILHLCYNIGMILRQILPIIYYILRKNISRRKQRRKESRIFRICCEKGVFMKKRFLFCLLYLLCLAVAIIAVALLVAFAKVKIWVAVVIAFCIVCIPVVILHSLYRCPHCGHRLSFLPGHRAERYDYCPYCGKKFDKPM